MSRLDDILREHLAKSSSLPVSSTERPSALFSPYPPVSSSPDLARIVALPRRPAEPNDGLVLKWTEALRTIDGTMTLRPHQAWAIEEAVQMGGLLGPLEVGAGKTLLGLVLGTALGAKRTVYLTTPDGIPQAFRDYGRLKKHWRLPALDDGLRIISYSALSSPKTNDILDQLQPDLIVADECHCVSKATSARTKRLRRYVREAVGRVRFVGLSGTMLDKSVRDLAPHARMSLGRNAPVPLDYMTLESWAEAIDPPQKGMEPRPPGALSSLCNEGESVREGFRRRVVETPGVVATGATRLKVKLRMSVRRLDVPTVVKKALADLRKSWVTPGGIEIQDALGLSRYARQLAAGFYYERTWPDGVSEDVRTQWLEANRAWSREVRNFLARSARRGMDSPGLLETAAASGRWKSKTYGDWAAVRNQAKPGNRAVWVSRFLVEDAAEWGLSQSGIVWYSHQPVGREISKASGLKMYGQGAKASTEILDEDGSRSIVVSVPAHHKVKHLTAFNRNLVTTASSSGKTWEQLLGRTHREGQTQDVECFVYMHTAELVEAFDKARKVSSFNESVTGGARKLSYCEYTPTPEFGNVL